jgi:hypothetical protein
MADKVFANGIIAKRRENAPDFVKASLSFKVDEAVEFLQKHAKNGWVNVDVKVGKEGKWYCELDIWQPTPKDSYDKFAQQVRDGVFKEEQKVKYPEEINADEIPF